MSPLWAEETLYGLETELNLTPEQRLKIEEIGKRYREELDALTEEYLKRRLELLGEKRAQDPDQKRIRKLEEEIELLRVKRKVVMRRYSEEIEKVLSPEQKRMIHDFSGREKRRMRKAPRRW